MKKLKALTESAASRIRAKAKSLMASGKLPKPDPDSAAGAAT
jgi:hypothetical protein